MTTATDDHLGSLGDQSIETVETMDVYTGESLGESLAEKPVTNQDSMTDPVQRRRRDDDAAECVVSLVTAGHGFMVQSFSRAAELPTTCRYCNGPLAIPDPGEWFCEFGDHPYIGCRCNWCVIREQKLLRPRGGQPKICNSPACKRKAKSERQQRWRKKKRELATV